MTELIPIWLLLSWLVRQVEGGIEEEPDEDAADPGEPYEPAVQLIKVGIAAFSLLLLGLSISAYRKTALKGIIYAVSKKIAEDIPKSKRVHARKVRRMVAEEMAARNRSDIASSYRGERPENTRQERHGLEKENQPMHDNATSNLSKLVNDGSTRFARSTKFKSR